MAKKDPKVSAELEILGEKQFKQALKDINRALRENKSEQKAVAAEYDAADEGARDLSAQMALLESRYEQQSEKLRVLQDFLGKVEEKFGANSEEAQQLRIDLNYARTAMAKTSTEIKTMRGRMEDAQNGTQGMADDLESMGEAAQEAGKQTGGLAEQIADLAGVDLHNLLTIGGIGAAAGAVAGGVMQGLEVGSEVLTSWNQLEASTGATAADLQMLKDASWEVAATGAGDGLADASESVATVYQLTGLTGQALSDTTYLAMGLRDTFGFDVAESIGTVNTLMNTFGIDAKTAYDLMAAGAQQGANNNGDLAEVVSEYATFFAQGGKSADEMFAALASGSANGISDAGKIGEAWKEFINKIKERDPEAMTALSDLGFAADDIAEKIAAGGPAADLATQMIIDALADTEDEYDKNKAGVALFGEAWNDTGGNVLGVFENMDEGLGDVAGTAKELADVRYNDLDSALGGLKSRITELAEPALLSGVNFLINGLDTISGIIDAFTDGGFEAGMAAIGKATGSFTEAETQAMEAATAGMLEQVWALDDAINAAWASGDSMTAWTLQAQRDALMTSIGETKIEAVEAVNGMGEAVNSAFHSQFGEGATVSTGDLIEVDASGEDSLSSALENELNAAASAALTAAGGQQMTLDDLYAAKEAAEQAGDTALAEQLDTQIQMMMAGIQETAEPLGTQMGDSLMEKTQEGMESRFGDMQTAGEDGALYAIDGMLSGESDAQAAGRALGLAQVDGLDSGSAGMYSAGVDAALGAIDGASSQEGAMYAAGSRLGGAFLRGFRNKMMIHSPSRAAMEDMGYVIDGYLLSAQRGEADMQEAAMSLAEALGDGFASRAYEAGAALEEALSEPGFEINMQRAQGTASPAADAGNLAEAIREAMDGMAVVLGERVVGRILAADVSREIARSTGMSVAGLSTASRRW